MKKFLYYTDTEYKFKAKLVEDIIKSTEIYEFFYLRESIFLEDNLRQDVKEELLTLIDKQIDYMRTISHPIEPKLLKTSLILCIQVFALAHLYNYADTFTYFDLVSFFPLA